MGTRKRGLVIGYQQYCGKIVDYWNNEYCRFVAGFISGLPSHPYGVLLGGSGAVIDSWLSAID
jgi:hypothetical protein